MTTPIPQQPTGPVPGAGVMPGGSVVLDSDLLSGKGIPDDELLSGNLSGGGPVGGGLPGGMPAAADRFPGADVIACPECGTTAAVSVGRRRAEDFCPSCDFPLFWARAEVVVPFGEETGASLRRLPGTVGRAATAAVACPHCNEPNSPTALICVRCDGDMNPAPPPLPEPMVYLPPPPAPEPEPEPEFSWWWVVAALVVFLLVIGVLIATAQG